MLGADLPLVVTGSCPLPAIAVAEAFRHADCPGGQV
jgi:hypothetical protein